MLVTNHSALQWARTYENSNRHLAAWGSVFSAYAPNLDIIHRAGRIHSNVNPLSRLPHMPPAHTSPKTENEPSITTHGDLVVEQEQQLTGDPRIANAFVAWTLNECLKNIGSAWITARKGSTGERKQDQDSLRPDNDALDVLETTEEYWGAVNPPPNVHIHMDPNFQRQWVDAYQDDPVLKKVWNDPASAVENWQQSRRFFKSDEGLLFFRDEDFQPRLCVPVSMRNLVLSEVHNSALETTHAGPEKLWQNLSQRFYWKRMRKDIVAYCQSCNICQKTKPLNFGKFGFLISNPIPSRPYQSISMDFVVNLPWSNGFNAIYVVVDCLSKHASFIPTTTGLTAEDFSPFWNP